MPGGSYRLMARGNLGRVEAGVGGTSSTCCSWDRDSVDAELQVATAGSGPKGGKETDRGM
ncbi:hypothetical protein LY78DRAFT_659024 [Colletotrichum sublineola]|nr:hypothetical protein LY78DRAFT_659024 [Colletotrichum sublineola]